MSSGIVICSKCKHEVHQIGWLETKKGREHNWQHCDTRSPICAGATAEYPKTTGDIAGSWCGMDDI